MKILFERGNLVKIRKDLNTLNRREDDVVEDMYKYAGKIARVEEVEVASNVEDIIKGSCEDIEVVYILDVDEGNWTWYNHCFDLVNSVNING